MTIQISCPVCRSNSTRLLFSKEKCDFVECRNDKLVYVNPQPERATLKELYDNYGRKCFIQPEYTADNSSELPDPDYRRKFILFRKTNRLLEVGAAAGSFLAKCREDGWEVSGVELSGPSSEYARAQRGLNVLTGTIHEARFPAESFDVVTAWSTLEHVPDPREVITEVFRVLRPGGLFVFSAPNWGGISFRLLGPRYRYIGRDHLFYFSRKNAAILLSDIGFKAVRASSRHFDPIGFWQDWRGRLDQAPETCDDNQRMSKSLALKRSGQASKHGFLKIFSRTLLRSGYHILSRTLGAFHLGDMLFAEGVK